MEKKTVNQEAANNQENRTARATGKNFWKDYKGEIISENPQVYVGTYEKYNMGSIFGAWIDLVKCGDAETFYKVVKNLHCDEEDPEFMYQDYGFIPKKYVFGEFVDVEGVFEYLEKYDEEDRKKISEYWEEIDDTREPDEILDAFIYEGNFENYAYETAEEMLSGSGCSDTIKNYFDYERWEDELRYDYNITENYVFSCN